MTMTIDKSIFFNLQKSLQVRVAYNPPENSYYCNEDLYIEISAHLTRSNSNSPVILIGDLNSRTGEIQDFEDTDKKHTKHTIGRQTFLKPRKNQDKTVNNMGQQLIELCKAHDLQNGRSIGDSQGSFTFYDSK